MIVNMAGTNENLPDVIRPTRPQQGGGGGGLKAGCGKPVAPLGQNRRALSDINKNIIRAPPAYPYAANGLPGKKPIATKKPVPVRRPITRTISAQTTTKPSLPLPTGKPSFPLPEGKKPKVQIIPDEINTEDLNIIDVEDDFNAPMFVQHTEAMLDEIDKMDEDVYEEPVLDIDNADKGNPLAVV